MEGTETAAREVRRRRGSSEIKKPSGEDGEVAERQVPEEDARNEIPEKTRESEMRRRKTC